MTKILIKELGWNTLTITALFQAGVEDLDVLRAALLHDTVEDTDTSLRVAFTFSLDCGRDIHNPQEIEDIFGKAVRDIVDEVRNQ